MGLSDGAFFIIKHTPLPNGNHPISSPVCPMGVADTLELNPNNPYIHQRPKQKGFNIDKHDPNMEIIYFDKAKVGINTVSKYMPVVRNLTY